MLQTSPTTPRVNNLSEINMQASRQTASLASKRSMRRIALAATVAAIGALSFVASVAVAGECPADKRVPERDAHGRARDVNRAGPQETTMFNRLQQLFCSLAVGLAALMTLPVHAQAIGADGLIKVRSAYSVDETIARIKQDIAAKGILF